LKTPVRKQATTRPELKKEFPASRILETRLKRLRRVGLSLPNIRLARQATCWSKAPLDVANRVPVLDFRVPSFSATEKLGRGIKSEGDGAESMPPPYPRRGPTGLHPTRFQKKISEKIRGERFLCDFSVFSVQHDCNMTTATPTPATPSRCSQRSTWAMAWRKPRNVMRRTTDNRGRRPRAPKNGGSQPRKRRSAAAKEHRIT
jgi:hypothetical protein